MPRKRSAGHIFAIVIGCLTLLPGLVILAGGGALAIANTAASDGYFRFTLDRVESDGVAVGTTHLWLDAANDDAVPRVVEWLDLELRLRVDSAATNDEVFVGIARSTDVERYLSNAAYSEVVELNDGTPRYRQITGTRSIESPLDQDFWTASASGAGEQELTWDARGGRWSVVVMNADGSPKVNADIEVGARSGAVKPIAITLIAVGAIMTTIAIVLIVVGARGRRNQPTYDEATIHTPFPPPPPNSATLAKHEHDAIDHQPRT